MEGEREPFGVEGSFRLAAGVRAQRSLDENRTETLTLRSLHGWPAVLTPVNIQKRLTSLIRNPPPK
ncbi:hypothetical protein ACM61V_12475 [Sphingomonas sp. TX0543]|uniref:hypothetical protein n=1 Tax=Sphingomonas sp. TX0543 TaxID=3399682 RepID=UPI003AFB3688